MKLKKLNIYIFIFSCVLLILLWNIPTTIWATSDLELNNLDYHVQL